MRHPVSRFAFAIIVGSTIAGAAPALAVELPPICGVASAAGSGHGGMDMGGGDMVAPSLDQAHQDLMAGMAEMNRQMDAGAAAADIDVAFICSMIPHHQGAIDMAKAELAHGDDPWAKALAGQIIDAQEKEIAEMLAWLARQPMPAATTGDANAYDLQLVGEPVRNGKLVDFSVRLVHADTGMPVADAVLDIEDFNMEPEGMTGSDTVHSLGSDAPGVFRLEVEPTMAGRWALLVSARVPGEADPIRDTLIVPIPE